MRGRGSTQILPSYRRGEDDARIAIEMTIDELAAKMDERFEALGRQTDKRFETIEQKLDQGFNDSRSRDERLESLEQKMDLGFNDSKIRDERLEGLMTFGLEARDILRDEMHRRFDEADRKHDIQITLLKDAVQRSA